MICVAMTLFTVYKSFSCCCCCSYRVHRCLNKPLHKNTIRAFIHKDLLSRSLSTAVFLLHVLLFCLLFKTFIKVNIKEKETVQYRSSGGSRTTMMWWIGYAHPWKEGKNDSIISLLSSCSARRRTVFTRDPASAMATSTPLCMYSHQPPHHHRHRHRHAGIIIHDQEAIYYVSPPPPPPLVILRLWSWSWSPTSLRWDR